jgi:hypothetical protein
MAALLSEGCLASALSAALRAPIVGGATDRALAEAGLSLSTALLAPAGEADGAGAAGATAAALAQRLCCGERWVPALRQGLGEPDASHLGLLCTAANAAGAACRAAPGGSSAPAAAWGEVLDALCRSVTGAARAREHSSADRSDLAAAASSTVAALLAAAQSRLGITVATAERAPLLAAACQAALSGTAGPLSALPAAELLRELALRGGPHGAALLSPGGGAHAEALRASLVAAAAGPGQDELRVAAEEALAAAQEMGNHAQ